MADKLATDNLAVKLVDKPADKLADKLAIRLVAIHQILGMLAISQCQRCHRFLLSSYFFVKI